MIVCDVGLADGDGWTLLAELRASCAAPAIVVSGYGMPDDVERCRSAGFALHLTKPVTLEQLQAAIETVARPGRK